VRNDPFRAATGGLPVVLLLDDEPDILVALTDLLEEEFRVLSTVDAEEALGMLAAEPDVAVIVSDQRMPGMSGDQFLRRAREVSDAEALLLTGYADLTAVVSALNEGRISGYAHKPWEPAGLLAMVRQAAARAELTAALRTERLLMRALMEGGTDGLAFTDRQGRLVRSNDIMAARLHAGMPFFTPEDREVLHDGVTRSTVRREEGVQPPRWTERVASALRDEDGRIVGLAHFERDVTLQREAEERLRQADRMQALGNMAGGVAHDFNNLLTAILGSLELARRAAGGDARLSRLIETAASAAERGAALTKRLLSFSRQREPARQAVDASGVVAGMSDLLTRSIDRPGIRAVQHLASGLPLIVVDPDQLELALLNLCINARDAMGESGTIHLRTELRRLRSDGGADGEQEEAAFVPLLPPADGGTFVAIQVQDQGTGIPPDIAARIFEPFFTTKEVGHGTGLGLSMVYGFVQQGGGAIRLRSAPGQGSTFELCLPVLQS